MINIPKEEIGYIDMFMELKDKYSEKLLNIFKQDKSVESRYWKQHLNLENNWYSWNRETFKKQLINLVIISIYWNNHRRPLLDSISKIMAR
jgi:hypothetical protein